MRSITFISVGVLFLMGCVTTSGHTPYMRIPGLTVITYDEPYTVTGSDAPALYASMMLNGPRTYEGTVAYGQLQWQLQWRYGLFDPDPGPCRIAEIEVEMTVRMILPEWQRPPDAPADLVAEWEAFFAALTEHEEHHRTIAIDAARDMIRTLKRMRASSCWSLRSDANAEGRRILERYQRKSEDYDRETTKHQRLGEGPVWPPRKRPTG